MRLWLPALFQLLARTFALIAATAILIVFGHRSEAEKAFAVVLAAGLLTGVILSIVIGIRQRRTTSKL